jgi:putative heme-binding domain-containing protein
VQDCNERNVKTGLKGGGDGVRLFPISSNITTADSHSGSFSAACGVKIWRGGALPALFDGAALACDPTGNLVHADKLVPRGASFAAAPLLEGREMLASKDDWFRPVFLARGPDGALYVADMYRKTIEHPDYLPEEVRKHTDFESGKTLGRIWRVSAKEQRPASPLPPYRDEFEAVRAAANDFHAAGRGATHDDPRVRFCTALILGDVQHEYALPALAQIAHRDSADKWTRAAVLSGIAGREAAFLRALWPKIGSETEGELELLGLLGRCFESSAALQAAVGEAKPTPALAALWMGFFERNASAARTLFATPAFDGLRQLAVEGAPRVYSPPAHRLLFARLLALSTWDIAAQPLQQAIAANTDDAIRVASIRSLAALDANRAAALLLPAGAWSRYTPALREAMLAALLARPTQLDGLLTAIETGALPPAALNSQRRTSLAKHKDATVRERAGKLFASSETTPAASQAKVQEALALTPSVPHGKQVFKQLCATCHRLEQEGVTVGPDLLDIRKQEKANIAFHIIAPDAEIAPAFTAYTCEMNDGRALAGLLTSETPNSITLRQPGGTEENLLRTDLKSLTALPGSLMPTGLDAAMSPQDLGDLLAFLKGEK